MKFRSAPLEKSSATYRPNVHELTRENDESRKGNDGDDGFSASNLPELLRRLSDGSTIEIENLIGDLQNLRTKLQSDGNRIQTEIAKYAQLSQGILQLASIIADNVKKLPTASDNPQ